MCGRFAFSAKTSSIEKLLPDIEILGDIYERYNIAPNQIVYAITNDEGYKLKPFIWGLIPSWAKERTIGSKMINARAESLFEKPTFKNLIKMKRCLIVASGYYEWQHVPGESRKQPYFIHLQKQDIFTFAGLWDSWKSETGEIVNSATIITTESGNEIKRIHNRMPVIIPDDKRELWLSSSAQSEELIKLFQQGDETGFEFYQVSYAVNNPANDGIVCIKPLNPKLK